MTPDTAALRRDHYDYDYDGHCDDCGERHPCTVLALCDVADEVERLLPCDAGCTEYPEEDCSRHGRPVAEVWQMLTEAVAANTAARTTHAALVADLRALHYTWVNPDDHEPYCAECGEEPPCKTVALLDRHAPEEGS